MKIPWLCKWARAVQASEGDPSELDRLLTPNCLTTLPLFEQTHPHYSPPSQKWTRHWLKVSYRSQSWTPHQTEEGQGSFQSNDRWFGPWCKNSCNTHRRAKERKHMHDPKGARQTDLHQNNISVDQDDERLRLEVRLVNTKKTPLLESSDQHHLDRHWEPTTARLGGRTWSVRAVAENPSIEGMNFHKHLIKCRSNAPTIKWSDQNSKTELLLLVCTTFADRTLLFFSWPRSSYTGDP